MTRGEVVETIQKSMRKLFPTLDKKPEEIGYSYNYFYMLRAGKVVASLNVISDICTYFNISLSEFFRLGETEDNGKFSDGDVLKEILLYLLSQQEACDICRNKGQKVSACQLGEPKDCLEHMIELYKEIKK